MDKNGQGRKTIFRIWCLLSCLWVAFLVTATWNQSSKLFEPITYVRIDVEVKSWPIKTIDSFDFDSEGFERMLSKLSRREYVPNAAYPTQKFEISSPEFLRAKKDFPSFKNKPDKELMNRVRQLTAVQLGMVNNARRSRINREIINFSAVAIIYPLLFLGIGFIMIKLMRKYLPNELSIFTKRLIGINLVWVLGSMTWIVIDRGEFKYVFEFEYVALYFLPPIVFALAVILWGCASLEPSK